MDGSFRYDVRIETVAQIDRVNVVTASFFRVSIRVDKAPTNLPNGRSPWIEINREGVVEE
jgi:hypothetical protein